MNEIVGFYRHLSASVCLVWVAACGIDVVGVEPLPGSDDGGLASSGGSSSSGGGSSGGGSSSSSSGSTDAGPDVSPPPPPPGCDASACGALGSKWKPIALATGGSTCASPEVLRTNPVVGADACKCNPTNTVAPVCNKGTVTFKTGGGSTCTATGVVTTSSDSNCHALNGVLAASVSFNTLAPTGGSCTATSAPDPSKVTSDALTMCAPTCAADICTMHPPAGFRACVVADGDVACDLAGFTEKHLGGASTSLSCGACSTCTASATCTNVSVDLYTSSSCGTKVIRLASDTCNATGGASGDGIGGMIYNATVTPTYTAPPSLGTANVVNAKTVCCAP